MSYVKLAHEFGGVFEIGNEKDNKEEVRTENGWSLQYFFTHPRLKNEITVGNQEVLGYTGIILDEEKELVAVFFSHRKFFMVEYLKELSHCQTIIGYDGNVW